MGEFFAGELGKIAATFLMSMTPVFELRAGLPYGIVSGLSLPVAVVTAVLGNMVPVPFILLFIKKVFAFMRQHMPWLDNIVTKMENKADKHKSTIEKWGYLGLMLLVAIPLPGTGAWTGSLVAALLDLDFKKSVAVIFLGVLIAAAIMTVLTKFGIYAFF